MSNSVLPLSVITAIDPRIDVGSNDSRVYCLLKGGSSNTYQPNVSTSYAQQYITWTQNPPSPATFVNSNLYIKMSFLYNFVGVSTVGNLLVPHQYDSPASWLCCKAINTIKIQINNNNVSQNYSDYYPALFRYESHAVKDYDFTNTTSYMDPWNDLSLSDTLGSSRSPLAGYGESSNTFQLPRSVYQQIISNTPTSAQVLVTVIEPLFISPLHWTDDLSNALYSVQTLNLYLTLNQFTNNTINNPLWSHSRSSPNTITSCNVLYNTDMAPTLLYNYINSNHLVSVPQNLCYNYYEINRFITAYGSVAPGGIVKTQTTNVQLNSIPRAVYLYVQQRWSDRDITSTDCFCSISNINVTFANVTGILSGASQHDLYKMCRKNGLMMDWPSFNGNIDGMGSGGIGSIICMFPDSDWCIAGADATAASGVSCNTNLYVQLTFQNTFYTTMNFDIYLVVLSEGSMIISGNSSYFSSSVVSREDVFNAFTNATSVDYNVFKTLTGHGGGFHQNLSKGLKALSKIGSTVGRFVRHEAIPAVRETANIIREGRNAYGELTGAIAGTGYGGAHMTRDALRRNMRRI